MTDTTNDIDALLVLLHDGGWKDFHRALTALVAQRDEWKCRFEQAWADREWFAKRSDEADAENERLRAELAAMRKGVRDA